MAKKEKNGAADAPAKPEKPKEIQITSVKRTRASIVIHYEQGDGKFCIDEPDNPLPTFYKAMDALAPLVPRICHFPKSYADEGLRVTEFVIGSKGGATTVVLRVKKDLDDSSKEFTFITPERLLEQPTEEGAYSPPLGGEANALVAECIAEAKAYVKGDRAQGQIAFEEGDEDEDEDKGAGDALKFDATGAQ
jgi:hypothetical protein